jgi:DHA3 family macrolide efflux protein-like MFS transporter
MEFLIRIIKTKPAYARVLLALTVSGIGAAFTSVAVYTELARRGFGPTSFGFAFAAATLPGCFTSWIAGRQGHKWDSRKILVIGQVLGLVSLAFPLIGDQTNSFPLLIMAEFCASAIGGFLLPILKRIERESFDENDFEKVAALDTYLLTANFICGQGIGSLLCSKMSFSGFLAVDAVSYVFALVLIAGLPAQEIVESEEEDSRDTFNFSAEQKRALYILPWLASVCAPAMILLPAHAEKWADVQLTKEWLIAPVLVILIARTLGQIVGPFVAMKINLERIGKNPSALTLALSLYVGLYFLAFHAPSLLMAAALVTSAHIASNVVYTFGNLRLMQSFSSREIGFASSFVFRSSTVVLGTSGILIGRVDELIGPIAIFIVSAFFLVTGAMLFSKREVVRV